MPAKKKAKKKSTGVRKHKGVTKPKRLRRRKCSKCGSSHGTGEHRSHGKGSFCRTHKHPSCR